jgi:hypothetical protein
MITWQCFSENVYNLVKTIDVKNIDYSLGLMITNEVILNVNVFGLVMKLWIVNGLNVVLVVIEKFRGTKLLESQVHQQVPCPYNLPCSNVDCHIFNFSCWWNYTNLLLIAPNDWISIHGDKKTVTWFLLD